jgi:hypothetical protein
VAGRAYADSIAESAEAALADPIYKGISANTTKKAALLAFYGLGRAAKVSLEAGRQAALLMAASPKTAVEVAKFLCSEDGCKNEAHILNELRRITFDNTGELM